MPGDEEKQWVRTFTQYFCLLLGLVGTALISFSLYHDQKWNQWVDEQFNLNYKNAMLIIHMDDYVEIESQQRWIEILSRNFYYDKIYLLLSLMILLILFFSISNKNPNIISGSLINIVSTLSSILAAGLLSTSLVLVDKAEHDVNNLLSQMNNITVSKGLLIQAELNCQTSEHHITILRHCQMFAIKLTAIIVAAANACAFLYLTITGFFGREHPVTPDSVEHVEGDIQPAFAEQVYNNNNDTAPTEEERENSPATSKKLARKDLESQISQDIYAAWRQAIRKKNEFLVLNAIQKESSQYSSTTSCYQPEIKEICK